MGMGVIGGSTWKVLKDGRYKSLGTSRLEPMNTNFPSTPATTCALFEAEEKITACSSPIAVRGV
jgi:hypothetical protein